MPETTARPLTPCGNRACTGCLVCGIPSLNIPSLAERTALPVTAVEPVEWEVRPSGIEKTRFADPESFYLYIRRSRWYDETTTYIVQRNGRGRSAFTVNGRDVFLRHDVNAKHAHHATFEVATALATAIVEGNLDADGYQTWRDAEARHFPDPASHPQPGLTADPVIADILLANSSIPDDAPDRVEREAARDAARHRIIENESEEPNDA